MRIAVLGAGGPAGVNTCRALQAAGHEVIGVDENESHLGWAEPFCVDTRDAWAIPGADLYHAQPEADVRWLADQDLPKLMPTSKVIATCQHKPSTAHAWHNAGLRTYPPVRVYDPLPDTLHIARDTFGTPFWLRASVGAGAKAATLVDDLRTGYHWMRYWKTRGENIEWVAEEYLPGRDFCWTSVWKDGFCYASFSRERLEWLYPHLAPSGRTGTPTISVTAADDRVSNMARAAVLAVDPEPNGIYCVDLREDKHGDPRPTEINAGRWATTSPLYSEIGHNLPDLHARLATGEDVEPWGDDIYPAGIQLLRHIDCGHHWRSLTDQGRVDRVPDRMLVRG